MLGTVVGLASDVFEVVVATLDVLVVVCSFGTEPAYQKQNKTNIRFL